MLKRTLFKPPTPNRTTQPQKTVHHATGPRSIAATGLGASPVIVAPKALDAGEHGQVRRLRQRVTVELYQMHT